METKMSFFEMCGCETCVAHDVNLCMKYGKWHTREIPDYWDGTWIKNPSGNEIRLELPHLRDSDTEQEWDIFRLLFKRIATEMEKEGWSL